MKYVLDSCVALKWVLVEADSPKALDLRSQVLQQIHELLCPDILVAECAHALLRAERRGIIKQGEAAILLADILSTPFVMHEFVPVTPRAVEISSDMHVGFYDCAYVALAEREGCELVTSDQKMIGNLQARFPFIISLSNLP